MIRLSGTQQQATGTRGGAPFIPIARNDSKTCAGVEHGPVTKRQERYLLRRTLRKITSLKRCRHCGHTPTGAGVGLVATGEQFERASFTGLQSCGKGLLCPVCSAKIAAYRKTELNSAIDGVLRAHPNAYVSLITLTQRHNKGQALSFLLDGLSYAWRAVLGGDAWIRTKEQMGVIAHARATEITYGKHGWHAHLHVVMLTERDPRKVLVSLNRQEMTPAEFVATRWGRALSRRGIEFLRTKGYDWQVSGASEAHAIASYVVKMAGTVTTTSEGISKEAMLGGFKQARGENRTPFQILNDIRLYNRPEDVRVWRELERASNNRRLISYSKGFRDYIEAKDDDEICAEAQEVNENAAQPQDQDQDKDEQNQDTGQDLDQDQDQQEKKDEDKTKLEPEPEPPRLLIAYWPRSIWRMVEPYAAEIMDVYLENHDPQDVWDFLKAKDIPYYLSAVVDDLVDGSEAA